MPDQPADFLKGCQAFVQSSWDTWMRVWPTTLPPPASGSAWANGSEGWRSFIEALHVSPPLPQGGDAWRAWLQGLHDEFKCESIALFGLGCEAMQRQQAVSEAMFAYANASAAYQALIQRAVTVGNERLREHLAEHVDGAAGPDSLHALYRLWVDSVEAAYANIALSLEFSHAYGAMTNTRVRLRQLLQHEWEHLARELGMPTRSEVDTLGRCLQELRREVARLRRAAPVAAAEAKPQASSNDDPTPGVAVDRLGSKQRQARAAQTGLGRTKAGAPRRRRR